MANGKVELSRPKDKSLAAFKAWIIGIKTKLTGQTGEDGSMTEEKWKERHKKFWEGKAK